ncbi:type II toxin-antitoxin system HicB family antitoxin [Leclercia sp. Marseille-Q4284]|uniref:type II toxin-antitoxin system HicB family antitoxin n=1 Tax=Leclercia sp. Marseille-Q4284 TaxID=2866582 RepID=UPI001CE42E57|nr:type II toxin-antitoxin system HicB family antitoxin [Leclercia sp. Marseille-Q4284]
MTITLRFSIGIEVPENTDTAWGISVPAFDKTGYGCVSAAETEESIEAAVREAISAVAMYMQESGEDLLILSDAGIAEYQAHPDYHHCDRWQMVDAELPD